MDERKHQLLNAPAINGWYLFWTVTAPISIAVLVAAVTADLSSGEGVSSLVQFSVRCAVPLLLLVFAASSIQVLFPGSFARWLLRNRKYLGLGFAAAMAW
jgi:sulfoxide reductase heme-binding subunit YedZ